ncbi:Acyl-CoA dehydrogenase, middle domain [Moritella viscosa]|uniref:Acyl-CoA dehydrogenase, middle domain n=1 Tax=Moritella viscosa TaxID=80854 RepID=A0ABY1HEP9_9GAMM|nr:Acyl-CoA dehydrogenase, middle domain [Moritella viscosa]SGY97613.1 Acyl-CoA dehydrogenase, middle domain [Moritella viscosa]SGZ04013.1 Acyl-CoA dehydrogenase, middle domain [Moritella viscosa]
MCQGAIKIKPYYKAAKVNKKNDPFMIINAAVNGGKWYITNHTV